jgi:pimeloyl-ACP methyl ester carboxylesterase
MTIPDENLRGDPVGVHGTGPERWELRLAGEAFSYLRFPHRGADKAPLLHWAHATGFNASTYQRLLAPLATRMEVLALDMRGHGFSGAAAEPKKLKSWDRYRDDLVAFIDALDRPLYLAGHSAGAVASIGAAVQRPDKVLGLVLVEPVLMNRYWGAVLGLLKMLGQGGRIGLAKGAARRRSIFPDRQAALESYRGRGAFKSWPGGWLADYLEGGLRRRPDGQLELCCAPAWEARSFSVFAHNVWPCIARVRCPVSLLAGRHTLSLDAASIRHFKHKQPGARVEILPRASHFLPMEYPRRVREKILATANGL